MKKFGSLVLMLALLFMMSATAFAASSNTYQLDDLGMCIDIPSDYIVFTRDIADNDPNLSAYGLNKEDMSDMMESSNIYLNAWDRDANFEIIVTMLDNTISDFNLISDTELKTMASFMEDMYADRGVTLEQYEIYQHDQAKFIKIYINQPNGADRVYGLQYYTVYDNKAINVTMQSYSGKIDSDKESILSSIVTTVHFNKEPLRTEIPLDTKPFLYRDEVTGSEFTVPANWTQEPLSQDREILDVKFTSNREPGLCIFYGGTDMWAGMSSDEKKGLSRSDIDNSLFTLDEIAEAIGIAKNEVSSVSYGGKEYYRYAVAGSSSTYGINLEATLTCFMRLEDGYSYVFQFTGDSDSPYYKDFELLLESVKYPAAENTSSFAYKNTADMADPSDHNLAINLLLNLLLTFAMYALPIVIYRYAIVKQPVERGRAKKITVIYGVIVFFLMSIIIFTKNGSGAAGGSILFWSWINYKVLTGGKIKQVKKFTAENPTANSEDTSAEAPTLADDSTQTAESTQKEPEASAPVCDSTQTAESTQKKPEASEIPASRSKIMYCRRCGAKLIEGSAFCNNCGTQIEKDNAQ